MNLGQKETRDFNTRPADRSRTFLADPMLCLVDHERRKKGDSAKGEEGGGREGGKGREIYREER